MAGSYKGVYSTQDLLRRGMAVPGQAGAKKRFWMIWEEDEKFRAQPLSATMQPAGAAQYIGNAEFAARFKHEPTVLLPQTTENAAFRQESKTQKIETPGWIRLDDESSGTIVVDKAPTTAPSVTPATTPPAGEHAPENAAQEQAMRAEFATALTRLRSGQRSRAIAQIEALLAGPKISDPSFRHMFTEFGINLRKSKLHALALRTHLEARRLSPQDSHILFNAARVTYDLNDMQQTRAFLNDALKLSPDLEPARRFLDFLERKTAE